MATSELEELRSGPAAVGPRLRVADAPRVAATPWRSALAGPAVALVALAAAEVATRSAGVPLRDPGMVATRRLAIAVGMVVALSAVDAVARAVRRAGARWTRERVALVALALVCFHVTYLAYRNIKSVAPLLRPGDLLDAQLLDIDRWLFAGSSPGALLHGLLGTGAAAHVLSASYMLFFTLIPVTLAAGLVLLPDIRAGLHLATGLSLAWLLGAGSYLLLPSIGPFHADPAAFAALPHTSVGDLQHLLLAQRETFLAHPSATGAFQSIGAFASLHTAICATALLAAHRLGVPWVLKALVWAVAAATITATIYFGWHYLLDDVAGVAIAFLALGIARALDGFDPRRRLST